MPKLKKSARGKFLECISENLRMCCKIFGMECISDVMGVSVCTVYRRIENPAGLKMEELFRLSEFTDISPDDLIRPLKFVKWGDNP